MSADIPDDLPPHYIIRENPRYEKHGPVITALSFKKAGTDSNMIEAFLTLRTEDMPPSERDEFVRAFWEAYNAN